MLIFMYMQLYLYRCLANVGSLVEASMTVFPEQCTTLADIWLLSNTSLKLQWFFEIEKVTT